MSRGPSSWQPMVFDRLHLEARGVSIGGWRRAGAQALQQPGTAGPGA